MAPALVPCVPNPVRGEIRAGWPGIEVHEDVLYGPVAGHGWHEQPLWGVYGRDGGLVDAAAYYRGPGKALVGQSAWVDRAAHPAPDAPDETYVYGGILIEHFGHFLLSSLSRFWPFGESGLRALGQGLVRSLGEHRILCHGVFGPGHWWGFPYMREALEALGIPRERLAWFPHPVRVRRLIVPRPAYEEHNFVHDAYAGLALEVGARLLGVWEVGAGRDRGRWGGGGPAYLSRTRYEKLSQGFENEAVVADALAGLGVEVVYPEELALAEQVRVLTGRPVVVGMVSSAFHAAAFSPDPSPLVMLCPSPMVSPNFDMLDRAAGLQTQYWQVNAALAAVDPAARIVNRFGINDPAAVVRGVLALVQAACVNPRAAGGVGAANVGEP